VALDRGKSIAGRRKDAAKQFLLPAALKPSDADDFALAQAFDRFGGPYRNKPPIIEGGGSSDFIKWWAAKSASGYTTISMNTTPGIGGAAFWLSLALVKGAEAPKLMIMPVATVTLSLPPTFLNTTRPRAESDHPVSASYPQDLK
jgi:ribose transport system substrate-binding protein